MKCKFPLKISRGITAFFSIYLFTKNNLRISQLYYVEGKSFFRM